MILRSRLPWALTAITVLALTAACSKVRRAEVAVPSPTATGGAISTPEATQILIGTCVPVTDAPEGPLVVRSDGTFTWNNITGTWKPHRSGFLFTGPHAEPFSGKFDGDRFLIDYDVPGVDLVYRCDWPNEVLGPAA